MTDDTTVVSDNSEPVLSIEQLHIGFDTPDGIVHAVRGVDCNVHAGECLGVVGESGSGKSQSFLAVMGLLATNAGVRGTIDFHGTDLLKLDRPALNKIRGDRLSMIFQDPITSLTPHMRIGQQMREVLRHHTELRGNSATQRCIDWLDQVRIPQAHARIKQYPHELSGGMRQRVMIAMAMLCDPELLIADEPTTALDVTVQADILDLMNELKRDKGTAIVLITHDMGVVARMCDRVHVMQTGRFVETGTVDDVFYRPKHDYTKMLLNTVPTMDLSNPPTPVKAPQLNPDSLLLDVDKLNVQFKFGGSLFKQGFVLQAVNDVSFKLYQGQTLGIVGESGSGKSTLARAVLNLLPVKTGSVTWLGNSISHLQEAQFKPYRRDLQIVFQDPMASLNPTMTVGESIMEPLTVFEPTMGRKQRREKAEAIMLKVGLDESFINRYPHELSGGQNQRVGIARAIILNPKLVICDEAVSALDVSVQAQVLALLKTLQRELNLSFIFISHDLSVVWGIADHVLVLYKGKVVETGPTVELFSHPQQDYTKALLDAVPYPDPRREQNRTIRR